MKLFNDLEAFRFPQENLILITRRGYLYQYKETYRTSDPDEFPAIPEMVTEGTLSDDQLNRLKSALAQDWTDEKTTACDGVAWEFKLYENDQIVKHRDLGYIYGIEPYETIAAVLSEE